MASGRDRRRGLSGHLAAAVLVSTSDYSRGLRTNARFSTISPRRSPGHLPTPLIPLYNIRTAGDQPRSVFRTRLTRVRTLYIIGDGKSIDFRTRSGYAKHACNATITFAVRAVSARISSRTTTTRYRRPRRVTSVLVVPWSPSFRMNVGNHETLPSVRGPTGDYLSV